MVESDQDKINKWISRLAEEENAIVAVAILSDMGTLALDAVLHAYSHPVNRYMAENAGSALVGIGKPAVKPLIEMLGNEGQFSAAWTLGSIGDKDAVMPLISLLKKANKELRWVVVHSLRVIKDARAIEPLIDRLKDRSSSVRYMAVLGLSEFGDRRAIAALEKLKSDRFAGIQLAAAAAIANIEKREAELNEVN